MDVSGKWFAWPTFKFFEGKVPAAKSLETLGPEVAPKRSRVAIWVFPKIGVSQNGWFIMENPIKMG